MGANDRRRRDRRRQQARAGDNRRRTARRRTQIVAILLAALLALSTLAGVIAATGSSDPSPSTTTLAPIATRGTPATPIEPGAALTGPIPCPAEDGSSPRTTAFAEPPPTCIDLDRFHTAVLTTTAGPLTFQLNPRRAPQATNAFVVLARYHFYDGQPINHVEPRAWFEVGGLFTDQEGWGLPIPGEVSAQAQVITPGTIALISDGDLPDAKRGEILVATLDRAPTVSDLATPFGVLLDGAAALAAIDRTASLDGTPTAPITIESITVTPGAPVGPQDPNG